MEIVGRFSETAPFLVFGLGGSRMGRSWNDGPHCRTPYAYLQRALGDRLNLRMTFQFFDPKADVYVTARKLPHWEQAGATYFITFRTKDSLPRSVMIRLTWERNEWLRARGIHVEDPEW